nr:hypothetical protein [Tanacetum cinerariifolium]
MFQADDYDAFDSDVDEAPTAQTMFMENLSSTDPVYDKASPSYDLDILSEVHDHDHYQEAVCEHHENNVVDKSLTTELATYKEQVELFERRAKFELTEREQKIGEQLRIVITDRNIKEYNLKKEFHSVKMQLASTINHNKSMVEEVTSLKKDFKQKENKYLEDFLDMKALKEKVEDKLFKQDQSLQIVHMLCKLKPYYDEQRMVAIGYKSPLCLARAKQALTTEIKEMKIIFDELEAEVDQNAMNRKCDEIKRKNLLIENDTLIANCLSKEVFYIATNSELNVSRFSEMHDAHTIVQARYLELETELSKLKDKIQKKDHDVMVKRSTFRNNKEVHLDYLKHLKESIATLHEIVEEAKFERPLDRLVASAYLYTKHFQELLEYMIGTYPKDFNK